VVGREHVLDVGVVARGPGQVLWRHLGGHNDGLRALAYHLADETLAAALAVGKRGVDEVQAVIDRVVEGCDRVIVVGTAPLRATMPQAP
jgi:hypothetical protein